MSAVDSGLAKRLTEALATTDPVVSIRHNRRKGVGCAPGADMVPWCAEGEYLAERRAFTFDPAMHQGRYYVQDASSMFLTHILRSIAGSAPVDYLDACAAPGGKTTAAIDTLPYGSRVTANEFVPQRAAVLRENLAKWGYPYVTVTVGDTARFTRYAGRFDIISADVPCSGEGMMRKDAEAAAQWSPALVRQCVARQREIVDNLWPALKSGGYMVYSTCTFNLRENEEMVQYMCERYGAEIVGVDVPAEWGVCGALQGDMPVYRFMPHNLRGEGLFMAVLRKPGACESVSDRKPKRSKAAKPIKLPDACKSVRQWLQPEFDCTLECDGGDVYAVPGVYGSGDELRARIQVGVIKGKNMLPTQQLAMSDMLARGVWPESEVDLTTALRYLRHEAISLPEDAPKGVVLLTYGGAPLGFVKNLGNRANNLYPAAWRILSEIRAGQHGETGLCVNNI